MIQQAPGQVDGFWLFFFLHLANYTAMSQTLVDHVRNLMKNYEGTEFEAQNATRRAELINATENHLVKDLRNFISHYGTPPIQFTMNMVGESVTFSAGIDSARLLKGNRWSAVSRKYLQETGVVPIAAVVRQLGAKRAEYYEWFFAQYESLHHGMILQHDNLVRRQRKLLGIN